MVSLFFTAFITVLGGGFVLLFTMIGLYGLIFDNQSAGNVQAALWSLIVALLFAIITRWLVT